MSDEMDIPVDDVDTDRLGGFSNPAPGRYHGQIVFVNPHDQKLGKFIARAEILAGTPANQEGKQQAFFFNLPDQYNDSNTRGVMASKILSFAMALKLTTKEEVAAAKKGQSKLRINWKFAVGRQFCFEVEANDQTKSGQSAKDWAYWSLDDPQCKDIPKHPAFVRKAADNQPDPIGGGTPPATDPAEQSLDQAIAGLL